LSYTYIYFTNFHDGEKAGKQKSPLKVVQRGSCFRESRLDGANVGGLQAFGTLGHFEFHCLTVVQGLITFALNGGVVDEHVFAGFLGDKAETLGSVKPFNCAFHLETHHPYSKKNFEAALVNVIA
jgi:hypothetical protein